MVSPVRASVDTEDVVPPVPTLREDGPAMTAADKARVASFRTESDQWLDGLLRKAVAKERQRIRRAIAGPLMVLRAYARRHIGDPGTMKVWLDVIDRVTRATKGKRK